MTDNNLPIHYRLRDALDEDGVKVLLDKFKVIKETPKGYWVESTNSLSWIDLKRKKQMKLVRFVLKDSAKRFCYPSFELALHSYDIRKYRQVQRLKSQLEQAELVYKSMPELKGKTIDDFYFNRGINLGHTTSTQDICFDY